MSKKAKAICRTKKLNRQLQIALAIRDNIRLMLRGAGTSLCEGIVRRSTSEKPRTKRNSGGRTCR